MAQVPDFLLIGGAECDFCPRRTGLLKCGLERVRGVVGFAIVDALDFRKKNGFGVSRNGIQNGDRRIRLSRSRKIEERPIEQLARNRSC